MAGKVLLNLSGGIDSAHTLELLLQQGERVLVHHTRLHNWEGRMSKERQAVGYLLDRLERKGYGSQIEYEETAFDYGTVRYVIKDVFIWGFLTALILSNPRRADVDRVAIAGHAESAFVNNPRQHQGMKDTVKSVLGREPEWIYPIRHLTKHQVVQAISQDLLELCWWCRKPRHNGEPCNRCRTCVKVNTALKERES